MQEDVKIQQIPGKPLDVSEPSNPASIKTEDAKPENRPNPTRYGDWEKNGRCIDF